MMPHGCGQKMNTGNNDKSSSSAPSNQKSGHPASHVKTSPYQDDKPQVVFHAPLPTNQVIVRNNLFFRILLLIALGRYIDFYAGLAAAMLGSKHVILVDSVVSMVYSFLMGGFFVFVAFYKNYLLSGRVSAVQAPISYLLY